MHLRRALLLFAIVLGLAAVAASVSRPGDGADERSQPAAPPPAERGDSPTVVPGPSGSSESGELVFDAAEHQRRRLASGRQATVLVEVDEPGEVDIPDLGLTAPAEPLTPARFEVFASDPGRHAITFTPAAGGETRDAGTLVVEPATG